MYIYYFLPNLFLHFVCSYTLKMLKFTTFSMQLIYTTMSTIYKVSGCSVSGYTDTRRSRVSIQYIPMQNGHEFCKCLLKRLYLIYNTEKDVVVRRERLKSEKVLFLPNTCTLWKSMIQLQAGLCR